MHSLDSISITRTLTVDTPDQCFASVRLNPVIAAIATTFCQNYIHSTASATTTVTSTTTASNTASPTTSVFVASTAIIPSTISTATPCSTTVHVAASQASFATSAYYKTYSPQFEKRRAGRGRRAMQAAAVTVPSALISGCAPNATPLAARVSSACSCFLKPKYTQTTTITVVPSLSTPVSQVLPFPLPLLHKSECSRLSCNDHHVIDYFDDSSLILQQYRDHHHHRRAASTNIYLRRHFHNLLDRRQRYLRQHCSFTIGECAPPDRGQRLRGNHL